MAPAVKISALRGCEMFLAPNMRSAAKFSSGWNGIFGYAATCLLTCQSWRTPNSTYGSRAEDISARLYEFDFKHRRVALRPEITASVARAYVERLRDEPLPLRIQYTGPVFRYEKPQRNRYRQFTMTGAELLGAAGAES